MNDLQNALFDNGSLRNKIETKKNNIKKDKIKYYANAVRKNKDFQIKKHNKKIVNDAKLKKLDKVQFFNEKYQFILNLSQITSISQKIKFCKSILQKI